MFFTKTLSALLLVATATAIALPEPQAPVTNVASFQSLLKTECSQLVFIYDDIITGYTVIENDLPSVRLPPISVLPNSQIGTVADARFICSRFPSHSCPFSNSRWPMLWMNAPSLKSCLMAIAQPVLLQGKVFLLFMCWFLIMIDFSCQGPEVPQSFRMCRLGEGWEERYWGGVIS